jgi:hypothetical protein
MTASESEGCMLKKDYKYLLDYLEGFTHIPQVRRPTSSTVPSGTGYNRPVSTTQQFYTAFEDCRVPANGMLRNSQFVEWVRRYPMLVEVRLFPLALLLSES